ncbi:hypothetical protein BX600DRAFT_545929 [Xylariales sp. PMI_506]|nr:hypothetical protein BX600DRAFT_545929 [Xylariales sp. PMI_506]
MPLGASITEGYQSSDGNGYRKYLRDALRSAGWPVNMVGELSSGTMNDNQMEGWFGLRVDQIEAHVPLSVTKWLPNLVLLNAGTNDGLQDYNIIEAGSRLESMIMEILSIVPDIIIIVSTLLPNTIAPDAITIINNEYRLLIQKLQTEGYKIALAEMDGWVTDADLVDGTHPDDYGYFKMAAEWYRVFVDVFLAGWLSPPLDNGMDDNATVTTCSKTYGSGATDSRAGTEVLKALSAEIVDDGSYVHTAEDMGVIHSGFAAVDQDVWYAQLVNLYGADRTGIRDDWVYSTTDGLYMRVNLGDGTWGDSQAIDVKDPCKAKGIRWGDVNNDGLDDFICIGPEGNMYVSLNLGGNPPQFNYVGQIKAVPEGDYSQENVRLGDIDGDGRLDYCVVAFTGDIYCWRNGGQGDTPEYWQDLGSGQPVFTGKGMGDITGVNLVDLNGDFRADWIWLDDTGMGTTYINQRGSTKDMIPYWDSVGVTHPGMGVAGARARIRFGRVYSIKADYMYIPCSNATDVTTDGCTYDVYAWQNTGTGGAHLKGDGVYFCDMTGSGNDDYVWVDPNGKMSIFKNKNVPPATDYSSWLDEGTLLNLAVDRKGIHLGDWDGDGKCDILTVDKITGALTVRYNEYDSSSGSFAFGAPTSIPGFSCDQGWGVGLYDLGMQFADIDGDGRVDYLCLELDGRTTAYLNLASGPEYMGQVKYSIGKDRANLRWADVNGDGSADFMFVEKFTGDVSVYYNKGQVQIDGSSFEWDAAGVLYEGAMYGPDQFYPNLGGQGRADMVAVDPKTGHGFVWYNSCPTGGDGPGPLVDPELPWQDAPDESGLSEASSGDAIPVYIGPGVWTSFTAQCEPPCSLVLPPLTISPETFSIPPYTTSLQVRSTTTTITLFPPPVILSSLDFSNVAVTESETSSIITPVPSVTLPVISVPVTWTQGSEPTTSTRVITLPPWPQSTWSDAGSTAITPFTPGPSEADPTPTPAPGPPPSWGWDEIGGIVTPESNTDNDSDDKSSDVDCNVWFFNLCVSWIDHWNFKLPTGTVGPGPPPPSLFDFDSWDFTDTLPPWPPIDVDENGQVTYPDEPEDCEPTSASICSTTTSFGVDGGGSTTATQVSSTCLTIEGCYVSDYETSTTTENPGCTVAARAVPVAEVSLTSSWAKPTPPSKIYHTLGRRDLSEDDPQSWADDASYVEGACETKNVVIYPKSFMEAPNMADRLSRLQAILPYTHISSTVLGYTALFYVENFPVPLIEKFEKMSECGAVYDPVNFATKAAANDNSGVDGGLQRRVVDSIVEFNISRRAYDSSGNPVPVDDWSNSMISAPRGQHDWATNPDYTINDPTAPFRQQFKYYYDRTNAPGAGQVVYVVDDCMVTTHVEFVGANIIANLQGGQFGPSSGQLSCSHGSQVAANVVGATLGVAPGADLVFVEAGIDFDAGVLFVEPGLKFPPHPCKTNDVHSVSVLQALVLALDHILENDNGGKAVINMSWSIGLNAANARFAAILRGILVELDQYDVALVTASGNSRLGGSASDDGYPQSFRKTHPTDLGSMLVVGAIDGNGKHGAFSEYFTGDPTLSLMVHAPGVILWVPDITTSSDYKLGSGTSLAAPKVAGLVAYFRGLPSSLQSRLMSPSSVANLIRAYQRGLNIPNTGPGLISSEPAREFIWNGQYLGQSCLLSNNIPAGICPIDVDLSDGTCSYGKRDDCTPSGSGSGSQVDSGELGSLIPSPITFATGTPSPTCGPNDQCGTLCTGFYCVPTPTGSPPDYTDPAGTTVATTTTQPPTTTAPPPSCQTVTSAGAVCTLCAGSADPDCNAIGPPAPLQTASNPDGSSLCESAISGDDCKAAYSRYDENRVYTAYTSYTYTNAEDAINIVLGADDGCAAIFTCDTDADYAVGMAGWAIIQAFDYMYANDGVDTCGSAYFDNGCHITANACSDCEDSNA